MNHCSDEHGFWPSEIGFKRYQLKEGEKDGAATGGCSLFLPNQLKYI